MGETTANARILLIKCARPEAPNPAFPLEFSIFSGRGHFDNSSSFRRIGEQKSLIEFSGVKK